MVKLFPPNLGANNTVDLVKPPRKALVYDSPSLSLFLFLHTHKIPRLNSLMRSTQHSVSRTHHELCKRREKTSSLERKSRFFYREKRLFFLPCRGCRRAESSVTRCVEEEKERTGKIRQFPSLKRSRYRLSSFRRWFAASMKYRDKESTNILRPRTCAV